MSIPFLKPNVLLVRTSAETKPRTYAKKSNSGILKGIQKYGILSFKSRIILGIY